MIELEVVTLIRPQFDQTNDEVNQSPNSKTAEGDKHQNTETDLPAQEAVYAQVAEKEAHQHVENLADFAILSRSTGIGAVGHLLVLLLELRLRLLVLLDLGLRLLNLLGLLWLSLLRLLRLGLRAVIGIGHKKYTFTL